MKIYQKKNSKWVIDFTYKNRRIRRVIGESKRDAEAAMIRIKNDILTEKYGFTKPKKAILFKKFAKDYFELHSREKKSCETDRFHIERLKSFFNGKYLSSITPELVEIYKSKRKKEVSSATVNRELACLKNMFSKAIDWEKAEHNPVKRVEFFRENSIKERILADEEINRLMEAADCSESEYLKLFLIIALNTGMRRSEILSLKRENINFAQRFILIEDSKIGKSRKVPMNKIVAVAIKKIDQANEYIFFNQKTKTRVKNVIKSFMTACNRAGIKGVNIHALRHTAATKMINEAGVDVVTAGRILGHSSIKMTLRYCHPSEETMQRAVEKLGEIFEKSRHKVVIPEDSDEVEKPVNSLLLYN